MENKIELKKRRIRIRTINSIFKKMKRWQSNLKYIHPFRKMFVLTDTYQIYWLREDIPDLPHWNNQTENPRLHNVDKFLKMTKDIIKNPDITVSIDTDIITEAIKSRDKMVNVAGIYFDPKKVQNLIRILEVNTKIMIQSVVTSSGYKVAGKMVAKNKHGYGLVLSHSVYVYNEKPKCKIAAKDVIFHDKGVKNENFKQK